MRELRKWEFIILCHLTTSALQTTFMVTQLWTQTQDIQQMIGQNDLLGLNAPIATSW